ncbi:MAG: hypothetical protein ABSC95_11410 [Acetobacteraceae bacterium]|jgi:hypothetical protein
MSELLLAGAGDHRITKHPRDDAHGGPPPAFLPSGHKACVT